MCAVYICLVVQFICVQLCSLYVFSCAVYLSSVVKFICPQLLILSFFSCAVHFISVGPFICLLSFGGSNFLRSSLLFRLGVLIIRRGMRVESKVKVSQKFLVCWYV